jgi:hypothetical protein
MAVPVGGMEYPDAELVATSLWHARRKRRLALLGFTGPERRLELIERMLGINVFCETKDYFLRRKRLDKVGFRIHLTNRPSRMLPQCRRLSRRSRQDSDRVPAGFDRPPAPDCSHCRPNRR